LRVFRQTGTGSGWTTRSRPASGRSSSPRAHIAPKIRFLTLLNASVVGRLEHGVPISTVSLRSSGRAVTRTSLAPPPVYADGREADFHCSDCAETNGGWQDGRWRKARVVEAAEAAVKVEATGGGGGGEGDTGAGGGGGGGGGGGPRTSRSGSQGRSGRGASSTGEGARGAEEAGGRWGRHKYAAGNRSAVGHGGGQGRARGAGLRG
jgi:hypothetical protein